MAYVSDFTFNNLSRIGNDECCLDQNSIQNSSACNYTLQNYFAKDCSMNSARALATAQPGINYSGSMGSDMCGSNINESSQLLIGGIQTHPKTRIDLFGRPFATVPYLGRGSVDPILESQIQQGESLTNKRTVTRLSETNYMAYHTTPLIPEVKQNIQNSNLMIESDASEGWIRGGVPSRELTRDRDFYTAHTAGQAMP
uniref:Uncharacterized protein n=1 Tax=viral metagenome TaxID=1070528 RepID=A0A6C0KQI1_9ZZZZ